MSPRKKKDPAAQLAETATIAFAEAQVAAHPRGAPDTFHVALDTTPPVTAVPERPCALETAPNGAKCVVSRTDEGKAVRLLHGESVTTLGPEDVFQTLPAGVKVQKVGPATYRVFKMGISGDPVFEAGSARDAVTRYLTMA